MKSKLEVIKELVEIETGIRNISIKERSKELVEARVIFIVLAKEKAKTSYTKIGAYLNKNHATILHSYKVIYEQWKSQPYYFKENLASLRNVEDLLTKDVEAIKREETAKELFYNYRRRNTLLRKEITALNERIERLEKDNERLKQYEPIW